MKRISSLYQIGTKYHQSLLGINTQLNNVNVSTTSSNPQRDILNQRRQWIRSVGNNNRSYFTSTGNTLFPRRSNNNKDDDIDEDNDEVVNNADNNTSNDSNNNKKKLNITNSTNIAPTKNIEVEALSLEDLLTRASKFVTDGKIEEAIVDLSDAIKMDGMDSRAYGLRADLYEHLSRHHEALSDYKRVLELIPESVPCLSSMAECYANLSDFERAIKHFEQVLTLEPKYIPALGSLSEVYIKMGDTAKSLEYCKRILEIDPKNINAHLVLGHVAFKQGSLDNATKLYTRVIEMAKNVDRDQLLTVHTGSTVGPKLKKSNESNPIYGAAVCLAMVSDAQGNKDKQMEWVDLALRENPTSAFVLSMKGSILLTHHQSPEKALVYLQKALDVEPHSPLSKLAIADCLFDMNRLDESTKHYTEVLASMLERDSPSEANTRIMVLHNLMVAYIKKINEFPEIDADFDMPLEEQVSQDVNTTPQNLQELSKKSRALVAVLEKVVGQNDVVQQFIKASITALKHIALSSNQSLEIRHNQQVTIPKEKLLDPLDDILFYYYEYIRATYFGTENK